ncbi:hypothetical protein V6N12_034806 [Hibiscus sabdariffa]|uniref:Histidine-containing phosphotransfer protein n=1 Tax=Hibiscus sabdariffa TaxID=183260 RepID=A0ABR2B8V6_9ROSI
MIVEPKRVPLISRMKLLVSFVNSIVGRDLGVGVSQRWERRICHGVVTQTPLHASCLDLDLDLELTLFLFYPHIPRYQIQQPSSQNGSASVDVGVGCRSVASRHEPSAGIPLPPVDVHQGILDEQFLQLQQLQDESSPNFVSEVVNIYFHESEKLLRSLRSLLMDREFSDYNKMGIHLNQFMGSSSSIGANRIRNVCVAFRAASEQNNRAGCLRALELLEHEYCFLKNKLHELFQMEMVKERKWVSLFATSNIFALMERVIHAFPL